MKKPISSKDLPTPPDDNLLGHLHSFKSSDMHLRLAQWANKLGDYYRIRLAHKNIVVISNREAIITILKKRPSEFRRLKKMAMVFKYLKINGVFSAEGNEWKQQREIINTAFNRKNLPFFFPSIATTTDNLIRKIFKCSHLKNALDIKEILTQYTVDVIVKLAFGFDIDTLSKENNTLNKNLSLVFPGIGRRISSAVPWWMIYKNSEEKSLESACHFIRVFLKNRLSETKNQLLNDKELSSKPTNILQAMLAQQNENNTLLSDDNILANAITLLLAGEDTTANSLAWLIHLISTHPRIQNQLFIEINALPDNAFNTFPLAKSPLLTATIHESLRTIPTVPLLFIEPINNITIDNIYLKKNSTLILLLSSLSHDKDIFNDPKSFNPERWIGNNATRLQNIIPFGSGPRLCPGRTLALLEMQLAISLLIKNFRLYQNTSEKIKERFDFVVMPEQLEVFFEPRDC